MLKSYKAFTAGWYHILIWLFYPLTAVLCCLALQNGVFGLIPRFTYHYSVPQSMLGNSLCVIEIFFDAFCLGGICSKNYGYHELFKSSQNGKKIFSDIIRMDTIRRALLFVSLYLVNTTISLLLGREVTGKEFLFAAIAALYTYMLCTTAILLTRFTTFLAINLVVAYLFAVIGLVLQMVLSWLEAGMAVSLILLGGVSAVMTGLLLRLPMKKWEDSFYDC